MNARNNRVVTYLTKKYKQKLKALCHDREEREALIVREILMKFLDQEVHWRIEENDRSAKAV